MDIDITRKGAIRIVRLTGKLTIGEGDLRLRRTLMDRLEAGDRSFVLDLSDVTFIDSAVIGEIVASHKRALELGGMIKIVAQRGAKPYDSFVATWLDRTLELFDDEETAITSFVDEGVH